MNDMTLPPRRTVSRIHFSEDMMMEEVHHALTVLAEHYEGGDVRVWSRNGVVCYRFMGRDEATAFSRPGVPFSFRFSLDPPTSPAN